MTEFCLTCGELFTKKFRRRFPGRRYCDYCCYKGLGLLQDEE